MQNPRLAARYAKSVIDLANEYNQLEKAFEDMSYLDQLCKASKDFVMLLRSPVIPGDKKQKIVDAVTGGELGPLSQGFISLLIRKQRENMLPEIAVAFVEQYNLIKEIHKVKLTTAQPIGEELREAIITKIKQETALQHIQLEVVVREELIGGFTLEFDNNLVDASILRDLNDIRKQFGKNIYVQNIR